MNDVQPHGVRGRGRVWHRAVPGGVGAVVLAAFATAVAGCAAASAPRRSADAGSTRAAAQTADVSSVAAHSNAPPLAAGQVGSRQDVPWAKVGQGWLLAQWSQGLPANPRRRSHARPVPSTLFLVDPAGGRYRIATLQPRGSFPSASLVAWSGDGQRALLSDDSNATVLDLRTGASTEFSLAGDVTPIGFAGPGGLGVIANVGTANPHLERFSLTGGKELTYPTSFPGGGTYHWSDIPGALYSADGSELAVSTSTGMEMVRNDGQAVRFMRVSPSVKGCSPVRWWKAGVLLANCARNGSAAGQLWLVPVSGAQPATPLTAYPAAQGDYGDLDAWQLPGGVYLQDAAGCGAYVAKLRSDRRTAPVTVPGMVGSIAVNGAYGGRLSVTSTKLDCANGATLAWFDPATNSVTPLLGGSANGGSTEMALMFGQP
ncbi:MAG TPA: hypothetical protein VGS19_20110 [Streptosporangiaceae bacterium]|nr:hypothetical protein [Streptosporangiaceae bacterium]